MIEPARLTFGDSTPRSLTYDDVYFDRTHAQGIERMFFAPAAIARRAAAATRFTIGELGFGTGANFLHAYRQTRRSLHFISFEKHPIRRADLKRALAPFQSPLTDHFVDAYPPPVPGWHRRHFDGGRVQLSVWIGDVTDGLNDLAHQQRVGVDAWFLDGFAPDKNPAMWSAGVLERIAACSATGASVTTFTAAGAIRRRLAAVGFGVERIDQTPLKRHSTRGWYERTGRSFLAPRTVLVRGAGLAGAATAAALTNKGVDVQLVDPRLDAGNRASSVVPSAVAHGRLMRGDSAEARFRAHAQRFSIGLLKQLDGFRTTPVVQLPSANQTIEALSAIAASHDVVELITRDELSATLGIDSRDPAALLFPDAGVADLATVTAALIDRYDVAATADGRDFDTDVWATGYTLPPQSIVEVTHLGGQLDRFRVKTSPAVPVVGRGSFIPMPDNELWVGATYEYQPWQPADASAANGDRYRSLYGTDPLVGTGSFRGVRAVSSDRIPVAGFLDGRWLNLAHGSHGTTTAPFCAECVASRIVGEVAPASRDLLAIIDPNRFVDRQKRRPNPFAPLP